jgi:hypothetical protein
VIANHFSDLRDENKRLLAERENLRRALTDREEDVRLLRAQLQKEKQFKISDLKTIERIQWYYNTYFNETYGGQDE